MVIFYLRVLCVALRCGVYKVLATKHGFFFFFFWMWGVEGGESNWRKDISSMIIVKEIYTFDNIRKTFFKIRESYRMGIYYKFMITYIKPI